MSLIAPSRAYNKFKQAEGSIVLILIKAFSLPVDLRASIEFIPADSSLSDKVLPIFIAFIFISDNYILKWSKITRIRN